MSGDYFIDDADDCQDNDMIYLATCPECRGEFIMILRPPYPVDASAEVRHVCGYQWVWTVGDG